jgi:hypothetical protein
VSRAKLMVFYRGLKASLPAIMNKNSFFGDSPHVFINRYCASVVRSSNISSQIVLPCPEPMLLKNEQFAIQSYSVNLDLKLF